MGSLEVLSMWPKNGRFQDNLNKIFTHGLKFLMRPLKSQLLSAFKNQYSIKHLWWPYFEGNFKLFQICKTNVIFQGFKLKNKEIVKLKHCIVETI